MQHLLERACWDAGAVRDDVRGFVAGELADPQAVLVVDETGDVKKGTATAGVPRQYTGTAGRIENAQVAVYLTYAGRGGHALIDRRLYLPRSWAGDDARRAAAGIPADVEFATKPALAAEMIGAALDAGVPAAWQRLSAGTGAKGHRYYDWAWLAIEPGGTGTHWLLIRRSRQTSELAWYRCWSPRHVPLAAYVRVAGRRWTTEENFQAGKGLAGLDEHQVRTWTAWHRWVTLAMLALAFLIIAAAAEHQQPSPAGLIPFTRNEIAHLAAVLAIPPRHGWSHRLRWSAWRRRHQHRARSCYYQRQSGLDP